MAHRIRFALKSGSFSANLGSGGGPVEVDECFVGGEPKNWHLSKRDTRARFTPKDEKKVIQKTAVVGLLDRSTREVRAKVIPNVSRETLQDAILANIQGGSTVYTDAAKQYSNLPTLEFIHGVVNHMEEYVRGEVHTNGIENFWALLKRGLKGTYVSVEPFHLERYVDEQIFKYNYRATKDVPRNDRDRFVLAAYQIVGKRLTWNTLTGKEQ
jgi:transposase-like protein